MVGVLSPRAGGFQARAQLDQIAMSVAAGDVAVSPELRSHVVSGLGGVGKTQLAAEHARALWNQREIDILVWVEATTRQAIVASYARAAAKITTAAAASDAEQAAARWLAWLAGTDRRWLVVLDDVTDPAHLRGLWPPHTRTGRVVVTTRRRDAALRGDGRRIVEVGLFTPEQAAAFLTDRLAHRRDQVQGAAELAEAVGFLPLALAQTGAYIADHPALSCAGYLVKFTDQRTTVGQVVPDNTGLPDDHRSPGATTWALSVDAANRLSPAGLARPLMELAAVLDPNGIPETIFTARATLTYLARIVGPDVDADVARSDLACLDRFSLITSTQKTPQQAVRAHALVQRAVRETLTSAELASTTQAAAGGGQRRPCERRERPPESAGRVSALPDDVNIRYWTVFDPPGSGGVSLRRRRSAVAAHRRVARGGAFLGVPARLDLRAVGRGGVVITSCGNDWAALEARGSAPRRLYGLRRRRAEAGMPRARPAGPGRRLLRGRS